MFFNVPWQQGKQTLEKNVNFLETYVVKCVELNDAKRFDVAPPVAKIRI